MEKLNKTLQYLMLVLAAIFLAFAVYLWYIDKQDKPEPITEESSPQYDNRNPSSWSGVFAGDELKKDRL